ncbi:MAG: cation transporter [Anaerolineaceae bacterium]|nr:cation transporter [Anaerolineaceae bacterium]MCB9099048.1 cation transporter [Anaerolineales bacterium]
MINSIKLNRNKTSSLNPIASRQKQVNHVLWRVLFLNLVVAAAKIITGLLTASISILADGFHSAMDASSNVIGLIGSTIASRPPDHNHPYGHQKYETFATLGIGLLLLLTSWNVLQSVIERFLQGGAPQVTILSFGVMIITILFNWLVVTYEKHEGKRLNSSLLLADAAHTNSDIFVSLSVLVSLIAVKLGWLWIDAAVALIIVIVIGHTGLQIVRRASEVLADSAVIDTTQVESIVLAIDGVVSCHKIRSRGSAQAMHLDLHIQVDGQMPLERAHLLGHIAQDRLMEALDVADVLVHVEPVWFATNTQ